MRCQIIDFHRSNLHISSVVSIENQLEGTNHDHLGKIITYASGLDAKVMVWIVREAKEEHRAAIEWLNNNTASDINFFLIEIHAYRIGNSDPAPKFEVMEKPNDFVRKASTDHWYDVAIGTSEAHVAINLINKDGNIVVEFYINNSKALFDRLFQLKDEIEQQLGIPVVWDRLDNKKASQIPGCLAQCPQTNRPITCNPRRQ